MFRFKRQNTIWLAALSAMMALVILSGTVPAGAQAILMGVFALTLVASFINFNGNKQIGQLFKQHSPMGRTQLSPQAQEAVDRASGRLEYQETNLAMVDVGVIASQSGSEGLVMRRTRSISKDDDGVRPFVTLNIPKSEADRQAQIRFEIIDQTGHEQYIQEMEVFLRSGEMNIITDNHLTLMNNEQIAGMGDWDLRVYVNGALSGVHTFALTASYEERRRRLHSPEHDQHFVVTGGEKKQPDKPTNKSDKPPSLEELLRNTPRHNGS